MYASVTTQIDLGRGKPAIRSVIAPPVVKQLPNGAYSVAFGPDIQLGFNATEFRNLIAAGQEALAGEVASEEVAKANAAWRDRAESRS